jgi:hypothetical protein
MSDGTVLKRRVKVITYSALRDVIFISVQYAIVCQYKYQLKKSTEYTTFHFSAAGQQFLKFIIPVIIQEKAQM